MDAPTLLPLRQLQHAGGHQALAFKGIAHRIGQDGNGRRVRASHGTVAANSPSPSMAKENLVELGWGRREHNGLERP